MITAYEPIGRRFMPLVRDYLTEECPGRRRVIRVSKVIRSSSLRGYADGKGEGLGRELDVVI